MYYIIFASNYKNLPIMRGISIAASMRQDSKFDIILPSNCRHQSHTIFSFF